MRAHLETVAWFAKNLWFPALLIACAAGAGAPTWLWPGLAGALALGCFCKGYSAHAREIKELAALRRLAGLAPYPAETDEPIQAEPAPAGERTNTTMERKG